MICIGRIVSKKQRTVPTPQAAIFLANFVVQLLGLSTLQGAPIAAGVAKVEITNTELPANDPLYVKALVLGDGATTLAIVTLDVVAIGEIGHIKNDFLPAVRAALKQELDLDPANVVINASHCHGVPCADVAERTIRAVRQAYQSRVPVTVGSGSGLEDRIMENRRLRMQGGGEVDVRHAYSLPADKDVAGVGPVDPEIGILRLNKVDGQALAVVYNFACHPIMGNPSGASTADYPGYASKVIEKHLDDGVFALFLQGCAGDINPAGYKDVGNPRHAEPLGTMLGLSTLEAARHIRTRPDERIKVVHETLKLPRANHAQRITALEAQQAQLVQSLRGTSLEFKTFLQLYLQHKLDPEYPSRPSFRYLHEESRGREDLKQFDATNRNNLEQYLRNIQTMEELTRIQTNLALLRKHQASYEAAESKTVDAEVQAIRIGDFVLVTFPGEVTVEIGMRIKRASPHENTFVAGYTNGYLYYTPTAQQAKNTRAAQEDCECIVSHKWQQQFEQRVAELLKKL
jgi:hypothetical protein